MTALEDRLAIVRAALLERADSARYGSITPGLTGEVGPDVPESYLNFLRVANGAFCGAIVLFGYPTVSDMQWYVETAAEYYRESVGASANEWYCVGTVVEDPYLLSRRTGEVWHFPDVGLPWTFAGRFERLAGSIEEFVLRYAMGDRYATQSSWEASPWLATLRRLGLHGP
jgi:hypothetical protein